MNGIVLNGTMEEIVRKLRFFTDGKKGLTLHQFVKGEQLKREIRKEMADIAKEACSGK